MNLTNRGSSTIVGCRNWKDTIIIPPLKGDNKMDSNKVTTYVIQQKKKAGQKITMLSAYDYPTASLLEKTGIDIIWVSEALGPIGLGYKNVFQVTMQDIIHHVRAVARAVSRPFILATMPFLSCDINSQLAVEHAGSLIRAGVDGVEIEAVDTKSIDIIKTVIEAGIPVIAHIGLTRKTTALTGRYRIEGKKSEAAKRMLQDALDLERIGVCAVVLECVPDRVAKLITERLEIPTIGVGAGKDCDGQALITQDILNLFDKFVPKFVKQYADISKYIGDALEQFRKEVEEEKFPDPGHSFTIKDEEFNKLMDNLKTD
jgi:3-methyl-2-oxobutanoate hydroxymethyltransferase